VLSEITLQLHARIDLQDGVIAAAIVEGVDPRFIARLKAVRNDLAKAWGQQILRDQFSAHERVTA
jgi:hypothetical protein